MTGTNVLGKIDVVEVSTLDVLRNRSVHERIDITGCIMDAKTSSVDGRVPSIHSCPAAHFLVAEVLLISIANKWLHFRDTLQIR